MTSQAVVVHVTIEHFFDAFPARRLEDLVSLTDRVDGVLARFAKGWHRPSADEAILSQYAPWGSRKTPLDWAGALRHGVRDELGLDCSVGIAGTRVAARICSRIACPRGVMLWLSGYENSLIEGLPLEDLDELTREQLAALRSRGIRTMGELGCLAPAQARGLLGSQAPKLLSLVRGPDSGSGPTGGGRLPKAISSLARRLSRRLAKCGQEARGLELRLVYDDGVADERYTLLPRPAATPDLLERAARRLLEMTSRREQRVRGVSLTATGLAAGSGAIDQLSLFRHSTPREVAVRIGRA